jgi:hypothetical protein
MKDVTSKEVDMPRGDRTGPAGFGPMTGRGAGFCGGSAIPGYLNRPGWMGGDYGTRGRRGWRHRYYATGMPRWAWTGYTQRQPPPEEELATLKQQAEWLKEELDEINRRIEELESD